ncbi:hypothetical protein V8B55DRAFT_1511317 [Mucor lusitanicus]|uniref:Uncharacterized protein n=2 Tax=Mucor circinelloides f. lusitanicus TaxID=29924 RepID=A0A168PQL6_MUCCL|nr:hypothetical protein FB192DRAFT_1341685 [Mucor lusitanicus]OAD08065.1 hypothetical protein MUCCIDRAFT_158301 [Mucor lusitanicus CBS 277.49]
MFYANQPIEKSLPKPLPVVPIKNNDKALNALLSLPMQRFYNAMEEDHETRRIAINMSGDDAVQDTVEHRPKANTLDMLMHHSIQKATWTQDPLRLCIVDATTPPHSPFQQLDDTHAQLQSLMPFSQQDTLPYTFKLKSAQVYQQLMSKLYIVMGHNQWIEGTSPHTVDGADNEQDEFSKEYLDLAFELPFATAALIPPTPPPKEITTTPACPPPTILPAEAYSDIYEWDRQDTAQPWLYTREEESYYAQSLMTSSPRASTSVYYFEDDEQEVAQESWEAIFHPLSTFKHNKGELEYYAWNPVNLPVAAALVAQRVTHPTSHAVDDMHSAGTAIEATIPHIMPTPPLKPSPVLTIASAHDEYELEKNSSELTLVNDAASSSGEKLVEEEYYYDMLQKIRGSNASSLDESRSPLQSSGVSVMDSDKEAQQQHHQHTAQDQRQQPSLKRHALAAALLLGKLNRTKSTHTHNTTTTPTTAHTINTPTTPTAFMLDHNAYAMQDDKPVELADPETLMMEKPRYWTEKRLFWTGFVCPLLWYYGSVHIRASSSTRLLDPSDLRWQKRCRLAALYFSIVLSVVILVACVKAAGSAGIRQTQTDTIRAVIAD